MSVGKMQFLYEKYCEPCFPKSFIKLVAEFTSNLSKLKLISWT